MDFDTFGKGRIQWESSGHIPGLIPARAWNKHGSSEAEAIPRQPGCVMPQQLENH